MPRVATLVEFGGTAFAFLRARRPATARFRPPPGASCAAHPAIRRRRGSASSSRGRAASETPNRRPRTRFCRPPHPRSRLTSRCGAFSSLPLAARLCLALARRVTAAERGARRSRQSHERVSRAQRDFDPRRCRARALHARQNHAGGLPAKLGSGELSGRSAVRRAAGANQSAGTYGGVYVESR